MLELNERVDEGDDASFAWDKVRLVNEGVDCAFSTLGCDDMDDESAVEVTLSVAVSYATETV